MAEKGVVDYSRKHTAMVMSTRVRLSLDTVQGKRGYYKGFEFVLKKQEHYREPVDLTARWASK